MGQTKKFERFGAARARNALHHGLRELSFGAPSVEHGNAAEASLASSVHGLAGKG